MACQTPEASTAGYVGPGPGALTCGVLVIIFGQHPGVLHGHLGPLEASEEYRGGAYKARDQDST